MANNEAEPQRIYHIAEPARWHEAASGRMYAPESIEREGFIHCSFAHQVQRSLDRFFSGREVVIVLEIDPVLLENELRLEPADSDTFPHIYGGINLDAVVVAELLERDADGRLTFASR